MSMDPDDRCWAIIAELDRVEVTGRLDFLPNGVPFVRVILDDLYCVDCQIDDSHQTFPYTVYVRRYAVDGTLASEHAPYQAATWQMAAKCVELAHRCHEVQVRDGYEQIMHALEQSL